jgi:hypothetical protein
MPGRSEQGPIRGGAFGNRAPRLNGVPHRPRDQCQLTGEHQPSFIVFIDKSSGRIVKEHDGKVPCIVVLDHFLGEAGSLGNLAR